MENDIVRVKVLGLGAALAAGYVPDNGYLKHAASGSSIAQNTLTGMANTIQKGTSTSADKYPVVIGGVIFPKGLVVAEAQSVKYKRADGASREAIRFEDGTTAIETAPGQYEVLTAETLHELHKDERKTAKA